MIIILTSKIVLNMFKRYLLLLLMVPVVFGYRQTLAQTSLSGNLVEFHSRGNLPNFFKTVKSGKEVTVAYIGGSITEANKGWRDMTFDWFGTTFPNTKFIQVNATIGGTGSNLGVFRMDQDVLIHHPDLVFVEFAVNDGGPAEGIYKSMEGIVRKTWRQYPNTDICFVYTIAENGVQSLREGHYQNTAMAMEKVADFYQIPSIHMGVEVIHLLDSGKLVFTGVPEEHPGKIVFTKDKTHPIPASGHPIYAKVVERNFEKMAGIIKEEQHHLSTPFIKDNWEEAQMIPLSKLGIKNDWVVLSATDTISEKFVKFMPTIYKATKPGASFTIKFSGSVLGVYDLIGPKSGIVSITIDEGQPVEVNRFDAYANSYRKNAFFLKPLSDGEHKVTFLVTGKQFDKASILAKRFLTMTNPDQYAENSWFVGDVLIVGKLLK
jgi:lysophospholipase L1-like esterase